MPSLAGWNGSAGRRLDTPAVLRRTILQWNKRSASTSEQQQKLLWTILTRDWASPLQGAECCGVNRGTRVCPGHIVQLRQFQLVPGYHRKPSWHHSGRYMQIRFLFFLWPTLLCSISPTKHDFYQKCFSLKTSRC